MLPSNGAWPPRRSKLPNDGSRVTNQTGNDSIDPPDRESADLTVTRAGETLAELLARPLPGGLYLVSTPIGNLADISLRALSVLSRASLIAAEDTRHSKTLLSRFGIATDMTPYHEHNAARERPKLLARLGAGESVALISDAGTPLVSDPGYKLVRAALDAGVPVTSIPGPSAALAALTCAGLPTDAFTFAGFLPPKQGPRRARLEALKTVPATLILFETAGRLAKSLTDMAGVLGPREAVVARELTKLHETVLHGTLETLAEAIGTDGVKGEVVVVVAPPGSEDGEVSDERIAAELEAALKTQSLRDAVREVAEALQASRARVYDIGLSLKGRGGK